MPPTALHYSFGVTNAPFGGISHVYGGFSLRSRLFIWVSNPHMINAHQFLFEDLLDDGEILHREVDILELTVLGLFLDNVVDELAYVILVGLLEAA